MLKSTNLIVTCQFILLFIVSCGKDNKSVDIATTIYPFRQIIEKVTGPDNTVHNLMPASASPHTFRLKPSDFRIVEQAEILFMGGKNLDSWANDLPFKKSINMLSLIPPDSILYFEPDGKVADPHFWTDPLIVRALLPALRDSLIRFTSINHQKIKENTDKFSSDLLQLHNSISRQLIPYHGTVVVLSHPFFSYYLQRYGFEVAHIIVKHPGHHPGPRAVENIIRELKLKNVSIILTHPSHSDDIAKLISEATEIPVCQLDPLGGRKEIRTYQDMIRYNTNKLTEFLK